MQVLDQVRGLFEELAKLLGTADAAMRAKGWQPRAANTVTASTSASLLAPRRWMPQTVFRFYGRSDRPELLAAVSVLLGSDADLDAQAPEEPAVCGLLFDFGRGHAAGDSWKYDYAAWHQWVPDARYDGTLQETDPTKLGVGKECKAQRMYSLAVPLTEITDSRQLSERVMDPISRLEVSPSAEK